MSVTDTDTVLTVHQMQEAKHVVIIIQRLANSHHDDIGDAFPHVLLCRNHLPEKLPGGQIAHPSANGGGAELAPHPTADLRRNTNGISMLVSHDYAFHAVAVLQRKQVLDRTVNCGNQLSLNNGKMPYERISQSELELLAKVGHIVGRNTLMHLPKELLCPVFRLTDRQHPFLKLLQI